MVRRIAFQWTLAALALAGAGTASADTINFTGNVANDFPLTAGNGVVSFVPHPLADGSPDPHYVSQDAWMTQQGLTTGWAVKDVRLDYDKATDTLMVGVNFFGVAGDADGNGNPGVASSQMTAEGGVDTPNLGGHKSITLGFDFTGSGTPQVVAGVPADKSEAGSGLDGFTVANYKPGSNGLQNSYGTTLANNLGGLAFDPSAAHPGFEFTIKNFSQLAGASLTKGFTLSAYAGSPDDVVAGEDTFRHAVTLPQAQTATPGETPPNIVTQFSGPVVPEPTTVLAWSTVLAGGLLARLRRHRARA